MALSKNSKYCPNGTQMENHVLYALWSNEIERTRGAHDVSGVEELYFLTLIVVREQGYSVSVKSGRSVASS